jgi:hypothetical protein
MSVEGARATYAAMARSLARHRGWCWWTVSDVSCPACVVLDELATNASIGLDMAVAKAIHPDDPAQRALNAGIAWS